MGPILFIPSKNILRYRSDFGNSMLHQLKRNLFPTVAHFEQALVLTYALPREHLEQILPPGLELDTFEDFGFLAVTTSRTRDLRPAFLPRPFGHDYLLTSYRLFTRLKRIGAEELRGLQTLRSDTDLSWLVKWGNRLTRYAYRKASIEFEKRDGLIHIEVKTPGAEADLQVTADITHLPGSLPNASPFSDIEKAQQFVAPLPYTFDYELETQSVIAVQGHRAQWLPQPVDAHVNKISIFESPSFSNCHPKLASAFYLVDVPYRWDRGRRQRLA